MFDVRYNPFIIHGLFRSLASIVVSLAVHSNRGVFVKKLLVNRVSDLPTSPFDFSVTVFLQSPTLQIASFFPFPLVSKTIIAVHSFPFPASYSPFRLAASESTVSCFFFLCQPLFLVFLKFFLAVSGDRVHFVKTGLINRSVLQQIARISKRCAIFILSDQRNGAIYTTIPHFRSSEKTDKSHKSFIDFRIFENG